MKGSSYGYYVLDDALNSLLVVFHCSLNLIADLLYFL